MLFQVYLLLPYRRAALKLADNDTRRTPTLLHDGTWLQLSTAEMMAANRVTFSTILEKIVSI